MLLLKEITTSTEFPTSYRNKNKICLWGYIKLCFTLTVTPCKLRDVDDPV